MNRPQTTIQTLLRHFILLVLNSANYTHVGVECPFLSLFAPLLFFGSNGALTGTELQNNHKTAIA